MEYSLCYKIYKVNSIELSFEKCLITFGQGIKLFTTENREISLCEEIVWYGTLFNNKVLYQSKNGGVINYINISNNEKGFIKRYNFFLFKNIRNKYNNSLIVKSDIGNLEITANLKINIISLNGRLPKYIYSSYALKISNKIQCINLANNAIIWEKLTSSLSSKDNTKSYYKRKLKLKSYLII